MTLLMFCNTIWPRCTTPAEFKKQEFNSFTVSAHNQLVPRHRDIRVWQTKPLSSWWLGCSARELWERGVSQGTCAVPGPHLCDPPRHAWEPTLLNY